MANKKYSDAKLAQAKKLYMDYTPLSQIEIATGIPKSSFRYHIEKYWRAEREYKKAELFEALTDAKKAEFTSITQTTIKILKKSLEALANRPNPPTMQEAAKAADIMNVLDKITRLDKGDPTDIISNEEKVIEIVDLKKKLAQDPFDIPEVEYKEEKNDESIN